MLVRHVIILLVCCKEGGCAAGDAAFQGLVGKLGFLGGREVLCVYAEASLGGAFGYVSLAVDKGGEGALAVVALEGVHGEEGGFDFGWCDEGGHGEE